MSVLTSNLLHLCKIYKDELYSVWQALLFISCVFSVFNVWQSQTVLTQETAFFKCVSTN